MTKAKQKKVRELAGENFRYLEFVPGDMVKKLNAVQVAALCALISDQRLSAVQSFKLEVAAKRLARFRFDWKRFGEWVKSARLGIRGNVELPRLSVGVGVVRAWLGKI